MLPVVG